MSSETFAVPAWDEWASSMSVILCVAVLSVVLSVHLFKTYQDFCTKERKSLSHRRSKPTITSSYKLNATLTIISVFGYLLCCIFNLIQNNTSRNEKDCRRWGLPVLYSWMIAKTCLYLLFISRLHQIYGESAYGYRLRNLIIVGTIIVLVIGATMVGQAIVIKDADIYQGYKNFPYYCHFLIFQPLLVIMAFTDVILAFSCLTAFLIPLRKTIQGVKSQNSKSSSARTIHSKMVYVGTKVTVLVIAAIVSTLLLLLLIIAAGATALGVIDFTVNSICILLMTAYYSEVYYQKLCCLCICCCDKRGNSLKQDVNKTIDLNESKTTSTTVPQTSINISSKTTTKSIDTMDQIQAAQPPKAETYIASHDEDHEIP